jgi:hypothetical protein
MKVPTQTIPSVHFCVGVGPGAPSLPSRVVFSIDIPNRVFQASACNVAWFYKEAATRMQGDCRCLPVTSLREVDPTEIGARAVGSREDRAATGSPRSDGDHLSREPFARFRAFVESE